MLRSALGVSVSVVLSLATASQLWAQPPFAAPVNYNVSVANPEGVIASDLNLDGLPDVIAGTPSTVEVFMNNGDGSLAAPAVYPFSGYPLVAADLNGDAVPDLAIGNGAGVRIFLNDGDGVFSSIERYGSFGAQIAPTSVVAGDFRRIGLIDLALITVGFFGVGPTVHIYRNDGNGRFEFAFSLPLIIGGVVAAVADVNNDSYPDLVTGNGNTNGDRTVSVYLNARNGSFSAPVHYPALGAIRRVVTGDLNNDGAADIVTANIDRLHIGVLMNLGDGTFDSPVEYFTNYYPASAAIGDFDGDNNQDIVAHVAGGNPFPVVFLHGHGDGSFGLPMPIASSQGGSDIFAADLDLNGALDVLVVTHAANTGPAAVAVIMNERLPKLDHGLRLSTSRGGNTGFVTLTLFGSGIPLGSTVKLACSGQADINGTNVVVDEGEKSVTATFDLVGATPSECVVTVTRPDGTTKNAAKRFRLEQGGAPRLSLVTVGFDSIRVGREQTFYVGVSNTGAIDLHDVKVFLTTDPDVVIRVPGAYIAYPPPTKVDADGIDIGNEMFVPLWIYRIPAGRNIYIPVRLLVQRPGDDVVLQVEILQSRNTPFARTGDFTYIPMTISNLATAHMEFASSLARTSSLMSVDGVNICPELIDWEDASQFAACQEFYEQSQRDDYRDLRHALNPFEAGGHYFVDIMSNIPRSIGSIFTALSGVMAVFKFKESAGAADRILERRRVRRVVALDPNEKIGSGGFGDEHYTSGATPLHYAIFFENKDTATAPVQEVTITDQLPVSQLDLDSLGLGPIAFGEHLVTLPPGQQTFSGTVDLRPAQNIVVRLNGHLNRSTGLLSWKLEALDPDTGLPPEDPLTGFLPPGMGGSVLLTVMPKAGLATGTQVSNQASIVFDVNAPILTHVWTNTLDNSTPTSTVLPLPAAVSSPNFVLNWTGADSGSGVRRYTLYVSENGSPFTPFLTNTAVTSATFPGQRGSSYSFYSVAEDNVGNLEGAKSVGEASTQVLVDGEPPTIVGFRTPEPNANGWHRGPVTVRFECSDPSGLAPGSPPPPAILSTDGTGQSVTGTCTDLAGSSASLTVGDINIDTAAPQVSIIPSTATLWPPNGRPMAVTLAGSFTDALSGIDPATAQFQVVDEYGNIQPMGTFSVAADGTYTFGVALEASRLGQDLDGRQYRVRVSATDKAGNSASAETQILVPHDQRR